MSELSLSLWRSAPLDARLRFASELLPPEDDLQGALKEAIGVVQLWRRGAELEAWAVSYPSLVADTVAALEVGSSFDDEAHTTAGELLREARTLLDSALRACGFEWISPRAGDPPTPDCRCEGEGAVVSVCLRSGLRHRGVLVHPAQVRLGADGAVAEAASEGAFAGVMGRTGPIGSASGTPDWLRSLHQRGEAPGLAEVQELVARGSGAEDAVVVSALGGLRSILSGEGGESLRSWLKAELNVEVLEPREGVPFDPMAMAAVGERRTVHEHEAGAVARLEQPGLAREGRILAPAEVVRYVAGETW